jgi:hypothetical protein
MAGDRAQLFISTATAVLQLQSKRSISRKIPNWNLSTLEVRYDSDSGESHLGYGSLGLVFKGELEGDVCI